MPSVAVTPAVAKARPAPESTPETAPTPHTPTKEQAVVTVPISAAELGAAPAAKTPASAEHADVQQHFEQTEQHERGETSMTSTSESSQPAANHSFWPKVILWVVVIFFGFMYLRSVVKNGGADEQTEAAVPAAAVVEKFLEAHAAQERKSSAEKSVAAASVVENAEPALSVKSAVVGKAPEPLPTAPAPESAASASAALAPAVGEPAPVQAALEPVPAARVSAQASTAALASSSAVSAAPVQTVLEPVPAPASSSAVPTAPAPAVVQEKAQSTVPMGNRKSQLVAEYEAMRKAAQEESRKMYERTRQQMPAPWGNSQGRSTYYGNPYYGNPYQSRGN